MLAVAPASYSQLPPLDEGEVADDVGIKDLFVTPIVSEDKKEDAEDDKKEGGEEEEEREEEREDERERPAGKDIIHMFCFYVIRIQHLN